MKKSIVKLVVLSLFFNYIPFFRTTTYAQNYSNYTFDNQSLDSFKKDYSENWSGNFYNYENSTRNGLKIESAIKAYKDSEYIK